MIRLSSRKLHVLSEPIADPFVARVTTNGSLPASMRDSEVLLLDTWSPGVGVDGFRGLLLRHAPVDPAGLPPNAIVLQPELGYLGDGDVLRISPADHALAVLYRRRSPFNALLVTERCNHLCLMCSQPPKVADDSYLVDALIGAIPLFARDSPEICITGGGADAARVTLPRPGQGRRSARRPSRRGGTGKHTRRLPLCPAYTPRRLKAPAAS